MRLLAFLLCGLAAACSAAAQERLIVRLDPAFDRLVPPGAEIEQIATGFEWSEGPVWIGSQGYLLFSDIPRNTIYRWSERGGLSVFMRPAGYNGATPPGDELGTNGLLRYPGEGPYLVACDHGNRAIVRIDTVKFTREVLAERYDGKRLSSPNDAAYHSGGALYFTDPPYGLKGVGQSPLKEQEVNGVYRLAPDGALTRVTDVMTYPNGLAFSPDEKTLYVAQSDGARPIIRAFDVQPDGSLAGGRVFFDGAALRDAGKRGAPDGLKVDAEGNVWTTGPGGVLVISPEGKHLGSIETGAATSNCAWGDDGSTLYITADMHLLRVRTRARGLMR